MKLKTDKNQMDSCDWDITIEGKLLHIGRLLGDGYLSVENPDAVVRRMRAAQGRVDLFTFRETLPHTIPRYDYKVEWDNLAALPVSTFEDWWTRQIDKRTRTRARHAEKKGVVVREAAYDESLVCGIWEIYNECPIRQQRAFPHYGESVETVGKRLLHYLDTSIFLGAYLDGKLIGFSKLIVNQDRTQARMNQLLSRIEHRDKSLNNALIAQAVKTCSARHIPYLVYGSFTYGKKQPDGLADFKYSNGFRQVDVPRYYIPVNPIGALGLRLGLHRGLREHIPQSLLDHLRGVRSAWYKSTLQTAPKHS